jgi:hypothetical protein
MKIQLLIDIELPEWAKWLAVDPGGSVYIYDSKPIIFMDKAWDCSDETKKFLRIGIIEKFSKGWDWKNTLRKL